MSLVMREPGISGLSLLFDCYFVRQWRLVLVVFFGQYVKLLIVYFIGDRFV